MQIRSEDTEAGNIRIYLNAIEYWNVLHNFQRAKEILSSKQLQNIPYLYIIHTVVQKDISNLC